MQQTGMISILKQEVLVRIPMIKSVKFCFHFCYFWSLLGCSSWVHKSLEKKLVSTQPVQYAEEIPFLESPESLVKSNVERFSFLKSDLNSCSSSGNLDKAVFLELGSLRSRYSNLEITRSLGSFPGYNERQQLEAEFERQSVMPAAEYFLPENILKLKSFSNFVALEIFDASKNITEFGVFDAARAKTLVPLPYESRVLAAKNIYARSLYSKESSFQVFMQCVKIQVKVDDANLKTFSLPQLVIFEENLLSSERTKQVFFSPKWGLSKEDPTVLFPYEQHLMREKFTKSKIELGISYKDASEQTPSFDALLFADSSELFLSRIFGRWQSIFEVENSFFSTQRGLYKSSFQSSQARDSSGKPHEFSDDLKSQYFAGEGLKQYSNIFGKLGPIMRYNQQCIAENLDLPDFAQSGVHYFDYQLAAENLTPQSNRFFEGGFNLKTQMDICTEIFQGNR